MTDAKCGNKVQSVQDSLVSIRLHGKVVKVAVLIDRVNFLYRVINEEALKAVAATVFLFVQQMHTNTVRGLAVI